MSRTICEGHVRKNLDTFWSNCKHFTLMPSIGYYFGLMLAKVIIFWISFKKVPMFPFSQKNLNNNEKDKKQRPNI